jgi:glycolate oxidase FAD binding subunit
MRVLKPDTDAQVVDCIREAFEAGQPLAVEGRGTKRAFGRDVAAETLLRLAGLTGITMYEPAEMVFTALAGTPLAEIEEALAAKGQCLAFEPGQWGPLWGDESGATIGGTVAAAVAGPRRFAAGAARDHLLGFVAVNGKGERFKAGGRVVKNVTGYDLPKLAAGSFGTLFALSEVTMRAVPRGTSTAILAIENLEPAPALRTLRTIAASPLDPTGLAHLPRAAASRVIGSDAALTLIRLEGQSEGVVARADEITRSFAPSARKLDAELGTRVVRAIADIHPLFDVGTTLWRISVPPTRGPDLLTRLSPSSWIADGAGGIFWFAFVDADDAARTHAAAREFGGHATLVRAGLTRTDDIFPPLEPALLALTKQLKAAFDPVGVLNPGRMYKDV